MKLLSTALLSCCIGASWFLRFSKDRHDRAQFRISVFATQFKRFLVYVGMSARRGRVLRVIPPPSYRVAFSRFSPYVCRHRPNLRAFFNTSPTSVDLVVDSLYARYVPGLFCQMPSIDFYDSLKSYFVY